MSKTLEGRAKEIIEAKNFATVSTVREDGTVQSVVVWVHVDDQGRVLLNTAEGRAWRKNAARNGSLTVTVANHENPYEFVSITGSIVEDTHEGADEHIDALAKKYMGVDSYPLRKEGEVRVKLAVAPERIYHQG